MQQNVDEWGRPPDKYGVYPPVPNLCYAVKDKGITFVVETDLPDSRYYRELMQAILLYKWLIQLKTEQFL